MKLIFITLCLSLLISLSSCETMLGMSSVRPTRQSDILSDGIVRTVSNRLRERYGLELIGIGGAEDKDGVWKINAIYRLYGLKTTNIEEGRQLLLDCINEYLDKINNDQKFRPYMKIYPFTPKNLSITILNYNEDGRGVLFPYIGGFSMSEGLMSYRTLGFSVKEPYAKIVNETYEEAVALSKKHEGTLK